jgi:transcription antitermination factor NusG
VAQELSDRGVQCFLPTYRSLRRWKDRRLELELALFPGYVFVRIPLRDRLRVLQLRSVVHLVGSSGQPLPLPESEMDGLRRGLSGQVHSEPHPYLKIGRRVRVIHGPLAGAEGILVRKKDQFRVVLSIDLIMRSVALEVDAADLEPVR